MPSPFSESSSSKELDAAIAAWFQAVEVGVRPDREAFLRQYPQLRDELGQFIDDYDALCARAQPAPVKPAPVRPPPTSPMHIILTVTSGPHVGQTFKFDRQDHFLVGRAKIAHFRLHEKDPFFSRLHFMVEVNPPACRLVDMKSTNGTLVNGKPVESSDLRHGDLIEAGDTILRVSIGGEANDDSAKTIHKSTEPPNELSASNSLQATKLFAVTGQPAIDPLSKSTWSPPGFVIESLIGSGGMGEVYRARRRTDDELVAIKAIKPAIAGRAEECQRFLREIDILRQLDNPNIVRLFDAGEHDGKLYFVMEYVEGDDLQSWAKSKAGPLSIATVIKLMLPILQALDYAHKRGFVHRDLKPGNILMGKIGNKLRPKLGDFGLARAYQESKISGLTLTGDLCGTPMFLSPEQITDARNVLPASDQYAAATVLYKLLTGHPTHDFTNQLQRILQLILLEEPVPIQNRRADIPSALASDIHRALAKDPKLRFPSITEFAKALRSHLK